MKRLLVGEHDRDVTSHEDLVDFHARASAYLAVERFAPVAAAFDVSDARTTSSPATSPGGSTSPVRARPLRTADASTFRWSR